MLCASTAMVWPWTLTFWPQNVIRSSVFQNAPVTKVGRKSINRYWRYSGNMKIWDAFGHAVILNFDLLTPKSNQFISVPRCTSDESWAKIRQQILEISRKHKTTTWITDARTDTRTHGRRHGWTTRKHIASAGAYQRQRLKKPVNQKTLLNQLDGSVRLCPMTMTFAAMTFDLLTPKHNQFINVPRCTTDKSLEKIHRRMPEILWRRSPKWYFLAHLVMPWP